MKSIFPFIHFIHFIPLVWFFDRRRGQGEVICLFMYALMFNYRPPCLPSFCFFSSSLLQSTQTELVSDSSNKSQTEPGSNQHQSWMAWESTSASSNLDNTMSGYQTCSAPHNAKWWHFLSGWVSWERHDLSGLFQWAQRASIRTARSLRCPPHGFDLQQLVPAMTQGLFYMLVTPSIHGTTRFIMVGVR